MSRALVLGSPPLIHGGGVAAVCRGQVSALKSAGFSTEYLSTGLSRKRLNRWVSIEEFLRAARVDASSFDVVVTNGPVGWGVNGGHSVHFYHGTYAGQALAIRPYIRPWGYAKLRYVDSLIFERWSGGGKICLANSGQTAQEVRTFFGYDAAVVWCPIDIESFEPGPRADSLIDGLGIRTDLPLCLFVGAGRPMKGEFLIYGAMAYLPDVQWLIVGRSDAIPTPVADRVVSKPHVTASDMPALLRSIDLLVAPSLYEPFGLTVAEALACGTPVLTTLGGAADLLLQESDVLDRFLLRLPIDSQNLAESIRNLLEEKDRSRDIAIRIRRRIEQEFAPAIWRDRFLRASGVV